MSYIDAHLHLDQLLTLQLSSSSLNEKHSFFQDESSSILSDFVKDEIRKFLNGNLIVSVAMDFKSLNDNVIFKKEFQELYICLGLHPIVLKDMSEEQIELGIQFIRENVKHGYISMIGEIGLGKSLFLIL